MQAKIGVFCTLRVVALENVGAFLDWNQEKDLLLPFAEQTRKLNVGEEIVVYIYEDNTQRPCSSMKIEKFLEKTSAAYKPEQQVDLLIFGQTDLGYKAIINQKHLGVLYKNEVFQNLKYGDETKAYIKKIREDGKIDLILQAIGHKGAEDLGQKIIEILKQNNGFLALTEKTTPEKIYELFSVSKKKYKMALGNIYKKKLIRIEPDGIRLIAQ